MAWFKKARKPIATPEKTSRVPEGLWVKCPECDTIIYTKDLVKNLHVCGKCAHHFRLSATERLKTLFDDERWEELAPNLTSNDPLKFTDTKPYKSRLANTQKPPARRTRSSSASAASTASRPWSRRWSTASSAARWAWWSARRSCAASSWRSSGSAPVIIVSCSGGARMMEGALSLMQMAKISAALARLDRAKLPYISILTDPTTGGVTASFAMLGDLNIAEPKALIGFAGPRVIEQTIRQKLPDGFQRSEFLLERGMLDLVVDRRELKATLGRALRFMHTAPDVAAPATADLLAEAAQRRRWMTPLDRLFALEQFGIKLGLDNIRDHPGGARAIRSGRGDPSTSPAPTARDRWRRWSSAACGPPATVPGATPRRISIASRSASPSTARRSIARTFECRDRATCSTSWTQAPRQGR